MRLIRDCQRLDAAGLLSEVEERRKLIREMCGTLYPRILTGEIDQLIEMVMRPRAPSAPDPRLLP